MVWKNRQPGHVRFVVWKIIWRAIYSYRRFNPSLGLGFNDVLAVHRKTWVQDEAILTTLRIIEPSECFDSVFSQFFFFFDLQSHTSDLRSHVGLRESLYFFMGMESTTY